MTEWCCFEGFTPAHHQKAKPHLTPMRFTHNSQRISTKPSQIELGNTHFCDYKVKRNSVTT